MADNPEGFWEHAHITQVNDEILARFGGTWHQPPLLPQGWERSSAIADLRERAMDILEADFSGAALWGWKDPRTCLTLPFWQMLLPPMRYVFCLRSPLSVVRSLGQRNGLPADSSGRLWVRHVAAALIHTEGHARLIASYENLLTACETEVQRLADFVGRPEVADHAKQAIGAAVRQDLRHYRTSLRETLSDRTLPFVARALYAELRPFASSFYERQEPVDGDNTAQRLYSPSEAPEPARHTRSSQGAARTTGS
jgi:hypothetical protein